MVRTIFLSLSDDDVDNDNDDPESANLREPHNEGEYWVATTATTTKMMNLSNYNDNNKD